ncbi:hypothetical protein N7326_02495 [Corynebacterium sp. ES2794-CONJ1]|uniref:hypothetical protein n=1 Tax=unclassified Corynebacterium TaxID=2624378 RepID=UPI002168946C|nr:MULTISPECIES: hypothetical protein [unclassified Corynebacterium]MCS4491556.1 hypothetical protein [Corynebacterium sp. ES2715-CONJ3]MCU9518742.1 hypothetical protein [Corynebacterium sp. ES2794-CONJ1]
MKLSTYPLAALGASLSLVLSGCASTTPPEPSTDPSSIASSTMDTADPDGPHAAPDRPRAPLKVQQSSTTNATISDVDLGNTTVGSYSAPIRGVLVTPTSTSEPAPLVIISHLRAPNCGESTFAFPCPQGEDEHRFDRGMTYLGEAYASQGYATLIPDLGAIFSGYDVTEPYDQNTMWEGSVGALLAAVREDNSGKTQTFGIDLTDKIDMSTVGFFAHSRSGSLVDSAATVVGGRSLKSVFAYAPAYDTYDLEALNPAPRDIPYLALSGDMDQDVGKSANLWLGHYLDTPRTSPALAAHAPGLGHMLINRTAAAAEMDDRTACDLTNCADAPTHEEILSTMSIDFFDATLRGKPTSLPLSASAPLPETVADTPITWLALSPEPAAFINHTEFSGDSTPCHIGDPMNPIKPDDLCPMADKGVVDILTGVSRLTKASTQTKVSGARSLAITLAPTGSYTEPTTVNLNLHLADGSLHAIALDPEDPALRNRESANDNGRYSLATIRVPLDENVTQSTIEQIDILAEENPVYLRGIALSLGKMG